MSTCHINLQLRALEVFHEETIELNRTLYKKIDHLSVVQCAAGSLQRHPCDATHPETNMRILQLWKGENERGDRARAEKEHNAGVWSRPGW